VHRENKWIIFISIFTLFRMACGEGTAYKQEAEKGESRAAAMA